MNLTPEQKNALDEGAAVAVTVDHTECIVLRKDVYDRILAVLPDDLPSIDEQRHMLREIGRMAGWDDPEMDVYNDLDPRQP